MITLLRSAISWKRVRLIGGIALVAVGALGLVLPLLPGVILILSGIALMGKESWLGRRLQRWLKAFRLRLEERKDRGVERG
jgi:uncharacterized protein YqgC (DUF456 family)